MSGILLDTNVISELMRSEPNPNVFSFVETAVDMWLSAVVLHELEYGLLILPPSQRREALSTAVHTLTAQFGPRILAAGRDEALCAAGFRARARSLGRVLHLADALIAATAKTHDLRLATRNVSDFGALGISLVNPYDP